MALGFPFGLLRQGAERPLQRQTGRHQARQLARPHAQGAVTEDAPTPAPQPGCGARVHGVGAHRLQLHGHQCLGAQQATRRLGRVGLHHPFAGLAVGAQGFK